MQKTTQNKLINNLKALKYMGYEYINPISLGSYENIKYELPNNLKELENVVKNCNLCLFSKERKNTLFGKGNVNAKIIFLNLMPTQLENESGDLLSGNSGDMLVNMCQKVLGISIDNVYILNILKCKPPTNYKNIDLEINICKSYIYKQIDIIQPKIILAFGESYSYLTNDKKDILEIRGIFQEYKNIKIMPTFDPAFILRNPSYKNDVLEDLKKVKVELN